jgi:DNA replication protein DnaC
MARIMPLLALDDLGSEEITQRAKARISEIVSERYNNRRKTILTMNDDSLELSRMYGQRTADRIIGAGEAVYCGGESMRLAG